MVSSIKLWSEMAPRLLADKKEPTPADATIQLIDQDDVPKGKSMSELYDNLLEGNVDGFYRGLSKPGSGNIWLGDNVVYNSQDDGLGHAGLALVLGTDNNTAENIANHVSDDGGDTTQAPEFQTIMAKMDEDQGGSIDPKERATYLKRFEATA